MDLVTCYLFCWYFLSYTVGFAFYFPTGVVFLAFRFSVWVGSFLIMFGVFRNDSFTFVVVSQSLLSRKTGRLKFCVFCFYVGKVGFYLGMCVTWVVGFNGCGLPGLVCFNEVTLHFSHLT